jgi:glutaminyl-peptide cyclotransferase
MKKTVYPGIRNRSYSLIVIVMALWSCNNSPRPESELPGKKMPEITVPSFSPDSAYAYTGMQVMFGPRVPNTPAHVKCGDYLYATMLRFADTVIVQSAVVKAFDGKDLHIRNIISSFSPEIKNRIMLCAHWDSRPFADQDTADRDKPILAANDGAASCAVLMEIARQLHQTRPAIGVDIIFFDAEDYGQPDDSKLARQEDSYCLGSQYWSKNPHRPGYYAAFGILLDMVASEGATFTKEGTSIQYASGFVNKVWEHGNRIGYSDYFLYKETPGIIDDHYYINQLMHIPVIDIVHRDAGTGSNFWKFWHTHGDTMDKISKPSLKAVGQTLLETIFREGVNS